MIKWSFLHATRGRPEKAVAAMMMVCDRATHPGEVEYLMGVDGDDPTRFDLRIYAEDTMGFDNFRLNVFHGHTGSVPVWDKLAACSQGSWLIQMAEDFVFPVGWDTLLSEIVDVPLLLDQPAVVAVHDGYRTDGLLTVAICNRPRFNQVGEFLHEGYRSVYSDDEFTSRAIADSLIGKCVLIDARKEFTVRHEHAYHNHEVPLDEVYKRQNSEEAYQLGGKLFAERNPAPRRLPPL